MGRKPQNGLWVVNNIYKAPMSFILKKTVEDNNFDIVLASDAEAAQLVTLVCIKQLLMNA